VSELAAGVTRTLLGHEVRRSEDPDLLTGSARFVGDLAVPGMLEAVFVRSPVAHGVLRSVATEAAARCPGVHSVWSAAELAAPPMGADPALARPLLAAGKVRFVGESVAVVLAETEAAGRDAAELVELDIDPLPAVVDPLDALADGAPLLFEDHGTNAVGGRHHDPDPEFFAEADAVATARLRHNRVAPVTMEPNGVLVVPHQDGSVEVWVSTQSVFGVQGEVARTLGLDRSAVRVRAPWVGGGFGAKGGVYPTPWWPRCWPGGWAARSAGSRRARRTW